MKQFKVLLFVALLMPFLTTAQQTTQPKLQTKTLSSAIVRGVSFDTFKAVSALTDTSLKTIAAVAWQLWKMEQWATLETLFKVNNLNGGWPPNNGAVYSKIVTLDSGVLVDRYGGKVVDGVFTDQWGRFVAPAGEPFKDRSLQDTARTYPYHVYRIIKTIPNVNEGTAIPWFGQVGLGLQYQLPYTINDLVQNGYLQNIPDVTQPR
ncbi:DUF4237 domain-containing protein [Taibaiella lutea]|uniref:DUF4237 domain-containing protein n=1 Tax=Taibaiella lutea TaxID=2608001 RepID=A0A5M6CBD6_9BACT|nr:TNT domain-containing protein [Taibaiella lutea]KAA5532496.1 DUF4237 domain-containing protein [Taibaiella lutea]